MNRPRWHRDENAQGLIEFAILGTMLMLLFLGTVDFARFMYYTTAIASSARVGAEVGINPCPMRDVCGHTIQYQSQINDFVMQAATCEDTPYVSLRPSISCTACLTATCAGDTPCATTCTPCTQDVCVERFDSSGNSVAVGSPAKGQSLTVDVGYNFVPITLLINNFFPASACYPGDVTPHTLCAKATGRVS
jgi:TadE-like protein